MGQIYGLDEIKTSIEMSEISYFSSEFKEF
jgi:hypothetical protein